MTTTQPLSDNRAVMLHLALCNIASADPGPESVQSLAHEMALIARQAIGQYLNTAEQAAETQRLREADGFAAGIEGRAREMLADLIGRNVSDTTLRMATDWLKQEARITTRALTPVREAEAISTASEGAFPSLELCVQFSDNGQHIRKWSRFPFEGGECLYSHPAPKVASDTAPGMREVEDIIRTLANSWEIGMSACDVERAADEIAALSASPSDSVSGVEGER
jgi:hypothetical protein